MSSIKLSSVDPTQIDAPENGAIKLMVNQSNQMVMKLPDDSVTSIGSGGGSSLTFDHNVEDIIGQTSSGEDVVQLVYEATNWITFPSQTPGESIGIIQYVNNTGMTKLLGVSVVDTYSIYNNTVYVSAGTISFVFPTATPPTNLVFIIKYKK